MMLHVLSAENKCVPQTVVLYPQKALTGGSCTPIKRNNWEPRYIIYNKALPSFITVLHSYTIRSHLMSLLIQKIDVVATINMILMIINSCEIILMKKISPVQSILLLFFYYFTMKLRQYRHYLIVYVTPFCLNSGSAVTNFSKPYFEN